MSKQGIDSEKRTALSSTDATDRHVAWVPLPLARQLLRATHDVPRDHYSARFLAALTCWETFAALVVMLAPSGSVRHGEALGGTMGGWMSATRRLLPGEKPGARRSRPKQEQLRSWLMEELGASASEDATVALLTLLPQARNKLSGVHGPVNEAAKQPHASALLLEALAEALDEERLLPRSTELVWVSESATASDGGTQVRGILLRGPERKLVKETAPSGLTPGRAYLASDGWRMVHPWVVVQEEATPPRVLFFAQAQMSKDKQEMRVELLDAFSGERVAAQSLGQLGQAVRAAIVAIAAPAAYAEQPEGRTTDAGGGASRRRLAWVAALVALVAIASVALVLADRQALRVLPAADWKLAFHASAADWEARCFAYGAASAVSKARFACERWALASTDDDAPRALREAGRWARKEDDRAAVLAALADPRFGSHDEAADALVAWACEHKLPQRPVGFIGYRAVRASFSQPAPVLRAAPTAGTKPAELIAREALRSPACAAVGSLSRGDLEPAEWADVVLETDAGPASVQVPLASLVGRVDPLALGRCRARVAQGRAGKAVRDCTNAALEAPPVDRLAAIHELAALLRQVDRTDAQMDWLASASHLDATSKTSQLIERACTELTLGKLPPLEPAERLRVVRWQWAERQGNLRPQPRSNPLEKHEALARGTCVAVNAGQRTGPWLPVRAAWTGTVVTGWMNEAVLSP